MWLGCGDHSFFFFKSLYRCLHVLPQIVAVVVMVPLQIYVPDQLYKIILTKSFFEQVSDHKNS